MLEKKLENSDVKPTTMRLLVLRQLVECFLIVASLLFFLSSCYPDEELNVPVNTPSTELETLLNLYIEENFTQEYGMAIRYRFVDRYVNPGERVTPPRLSVVRPMLDFIQTFWIDPYLEVKNGEVFFKDHVPTEIVFLGGFIFNADGTVTLGTADAGAQSPLPM